MNIKYAYVYNKQTEGISPYVVFYSEKDIVKYMNPVSFFWLKHHHSEHDAFTYANVWDDVWFDVQSTQPIWVAENKYLIFKKYYELLDASQPVVKEGIHFIGSFLEHYVYNAHIKNELERIHQSTYSFHQKMPGYMESIGIFIKELIKSKKIANEDILKVAFSTEYNYLSPYFNL